MGWGFDNKHLSWREYGGTSDLLAKTRFKDKKYHEAEYVQCRLPYKSSLFLRPSSLSRLFTRPGKESSKGLAGNTMVPVISD